MGTDFVPSSDLTQISTWWHKLPYSVLLPTGVSFDVLEIPAYLGEHAARALHGRCPISVSPTGRWMLFVSPGDALRPELSRQLDIVHHNLGSWVPAPPSRSLTGRLRWEVSPASVGWTLPRTYSVQHAIVDALQLAAPRGATL